MFFLNVVYFFSLIVSNIICCYICTRIVVIICKVFEEHKVINEFYIFRKICVVYCYDKNLINCYLLVVALVAIAIIFAIFILIVVSISLCVILFIFYFLILIVKVFALTICEKNCHRCNCESCERF